MQIYAHIVSLPGAVLKLSILGFWLPYQNLKGVSQETPFPFTSKIITLHS